MNLSGCLYITDLTLQRLSQAVCPEPVSPVLYNGDSPVVERLAPECDKPTEIKQIDKEPEKSMETCKKCQQNQDRCSCVCNKPVPCIRKEDSFCMNKQKTCAMKQRKCCKMELKSGNASHEFCSRAGPCQAVKDLNQDCCDIEMQGRGGKPGCCSNDLCKKCDLMDCQASKKCTNCLEEKKCCGELMNGSEDTVLGDKVGRDEDVGSRTYKDPNDLHSPAFEPEPGETQGPELHGSTVQNLKSTSNTGTNTTIHIETKDDNPPGTEYEMNQMNTKKIGELSPTDFDPGQTYLPDFILLPKANKVPDYDKTADADPVIDAGIPRAGKEPDIGIFSLHKIRPKPGLEYMNLSGCYQITGEGLR